MKLVERVLATNVYIDNKNQPHSIPLLLRYEPQIGSFLEGPTVPRSQEVQVEPTVLFVAPPVATAPDSESFDLIPFGQVSEMAPPINPFKLMGKTAKRSPYGAGEGQSKRHRGWKEGQEADCRGFEASSMPAEGASSDFETWVPDLMFEPGLISVQDSILDNSEIEISTKAVQGVHYMEARVFRMTKALQNKDAEHEKNMAEVLESVASNYKALEEEHFKNLNVMKEAEEKARAEASKRT
uniref:Uncharacterized protein n=1 Tax=Fagus sylvatica TaxID=28930 RepID=A0A2N9HYB2_FAGSY